MFLPVILQKDFGNGAWLFFIITNVVGATAFSFFITSADKSKQFVERHKAACVLFSTITIIFQLFFVGWVISYLSIIDAMWASIILIALSRIMLKQPNFSVASIVLWLLSLAVFIYYLIAQPNTDVINKLTDQLTAINPQTFYVLPLLALGFLLCPFLDLTFHRVVQAAHTQEDRGNRISFLVGFPLLFATLMIFSLIYADTAEQLLLNPRESLAQYSMLIKNLLLYFILQACFTGMVHWVEVKKHINQQQAWFLSVSVLTVIVFGFFASIGMKEFTYRLFMSFYGIIAPAYLWIVVFNKRRVSRNIFMIATLLSLTLSAIPLFFQSAHYYYCYPIAVAFILAARFLAVEK
jgi:hypothetical protein